MRTFPGHRPTHDWLVLGEELLAPLEDAIGDARQVCFIPHGWLHLLPLHALTVNGESFIQRRAAFYAPSAAVMARTLERPSNGGKTDYHPFVLGYTPNELEKEYFLGEARQIAAYFSGTEPILDENATAEELRRQAPSAGWVHLSCHGYFNNRDPLASSVLLSGGEFTARDWMSLSLQAELVTLSACQTGFSDVSPGDEIAGLSRSLFYAGAQAVLLTLWAVRADTTLEWMLDFYRRVWTPQGTPRCSKVLAFQQAVLALRKKIPR